MSCTSTSRSELPALEMHGGDGAAWGCRRDAAAAWGWLLAGAGMNKITEKQIATVEKQYKVYESMIQSMTVKERAEPELLVKSPSRR